LSEHERMGQKVPLSDVDQAAIACKASDPVSLQPPEQGTLQASDVKRMGSDLLTESNHVSSCPSAEFSLVT
jgi:hypothetical protein